MKYILLFLLSFNCFAALTEAERDNLRQKALTYCSCRKGTWSILFYTDLKSARAVCRNDETRVFTLEETYDKCE